MAITYCSIVLSAHHPGGPPLDTKRFVLGLGIPDVPYEVYGGDDRAHAGGLRIGTLNLKDFGQPTAQSDPWGAFDVATKTLLLGFAAWLSRIPAVNLDRMRAGGLTIWVIVNLWIEDNQMDYRLPPPLAAELGRLGLELYVLSNE